MFFYVGYSLKTIGLWDVKTVTYSQRWKFYLAFEDYFVTLSDAKRVCACTTCSAVKLGLEMNYLKIILFGFLAMLERRPVFTIAMLALIILPPIYFEWVRWFMLGIIVLMVVGFFSLRRKMRQMRSQFEQQYRDAMGGNGSGYSGFSNAGAAGFSGFNFAQGMRLEDFVKEMQRQADARQTTAQPKSSSNTINTPSSKQSSSQGEYVDFEEIE